MKYVSEIRSLNFQPKSRIGTGNDGKNYQTMQENWTTFYLAVHAKNEVYFMYATVSLRTKDVGKMIFYMYVGSNHPVLDQLTIEAT